MKLGDININELMSRYQVPGLSIALIHKGKISTECYGLLESGTKRNVLPNSIFSACSISKFFTSMLVMKLSEDQIIDLDEVVNNRLTSWKVPENEFTRFKKVTIRTLLSHQSGVVDPEGSFSEFNTAPGTPTMIELLNGTTPYCIKPIEVKFEPASDFEYSDVSYFIIHQLLEDITGKSFTSLMNELVFEPLKMEHSTFNPPYESANIAWGHNKNEKLAEQFPYHFYPAAAGLWTTPGDIAILVNELMNALSGKSKCGLSASTAKELISPQGCKEFTGLGVFLDDSEQVYEISSLGWGEGFQCMLVAYPYTGSCAVIMTNTNLGVHQLKGIIGEVYRALEF